MLQNAYFLAKIGADTAENERKFAEIDTEEASPEACAAKAMGFNCTLIVHGPDACALPLVAEDLGALVG